MVRYTIGEHDKSPSYVLETWAYEACRLFRDKLVSEEDKEKFPSLTQGKVYLNMSINVDVG